VDEYTTASTSCSESKSVKAKVEAESYPTSAENVYEHHNEPYPTRAGYEHYENTYPTSVKDEGHE
jgi:hypothetical protein